MLVFARRAVRVMTVLNWILAAIVAAVVVIMLIAGDRIRASLLQDGIISESGYHWLVGALMLVLVVLPLAHAIFVRLHAIILSADTDACLSDANADRLVVIAWCLVGINLADVAFGVLEYLASPAGDTDWMPSVTGWFAALLLFVLAGVFRRGAAMRADLEGTV